MSIEDLFEKIDRSIEKDDVEMLRESLVELSISDELLEPKKNGTYPDHILNFLLAKLAAFRNSSREGGWDIFSTILSDVENFDENQFASLLKHIEENYGYYVEPKLSYLLAEWLGGCRDEWAINTIEKWLNNSTNVVPLGNLKTALYEFLDSPLPYRADPDLVEKASQVRKSLNK
ncbi:MAG: hypothetical protein AMJ53_17635 [Gammaproteobacteria bacterium SG8_11]|nr:MAG: hypothetical protein AMJ53_17635 [Gammaproteobacteria bacterium SG8_11]